MDKYITIKLSIENNRNEIFVVSNELSSEDWKQVKNAKADLAPFFKRMEILLTERIEKEWLTLNKK